MSAGRWPITWLRNRSHRHCERALSLDECDRVLTEAQTLEMNTATVSSRRVNADVRRSRVGFFTTDQHGWLYDRVSALLGEMNATHFGFDLIGVQAIQYAEYDANDGGCYEAHRDTFREQVIRKLSLSIQLTDPADYDGGDLQLFINDLTTPVVASRTRGDGLIFPSYVVHRVAPVTQGRRRALVSWAVGPEFR